MMTTQLVRCCLPLCLAMQFSCSPAASSSGGSNNANKGSVEPSPGSTDQTASGNADATPAAAADTTSAGAATPPAVAAGAPTPSDWCVAAAKTQIVQSSAHASSFAQLCQGGQATALFSSLVANAYSGGSVVNTTPISPTADANGVVSSVLGVGIKLPISSATQFDTVSPKQGLLSTQQGLLNKEGYTPGAQCSVAQEASNPDFGWVRGFTIHSQGSRTILIVNVTADYIYQADQYQLGTGLYMYTSTLKQAISTIQNYEMLTAGLDLNGTGYLVSVANIGANDDGLSAVAASMLTQTIDAFVEYTYSLSAAQ